MAIQTALPVLAHKNRVMIILCVLLLLGFTLTSIASYIVSRNAIHDAIVNDELPLTSDNIYTEIQKDLIRPVLVSSMMASDTFLRDWVLAGEKDVRHMSRYLEEVKTRYNAFTSFFVSDRTDIYYQAKGLLKKIRSQDPRDTWYYRVRDMRTPYEINVDLDMANSDAMTIFINYRVTDYGGQFIGATGVGLTVNSVQHLIEDYQRRYRRNIYFVDRQGKILLSGRKNSLQASSIMQIDGLRDVAADILKSPQSVHEYRHAGQDHLLHVRLIPELDWYLFVEKSQDEDLAPIRQTLYINLAISFGITLLILFFASLTINRYRNRIEAMAVTDALTGLTNRQGLDMLLQQTIQESRRNHKPLAVILFDVDHFKPINDRYGHLTGDAALRSVARSIQQTVRRSDIACRWGGEEFLVLAKDCPPQDAAALAEKLRHNIEKLTIEAGEHSLKLTISLGVASLLTTDSAELAMDKAMERADAALYRAKQAGRNRVELAISDEQTPS
jgi:diguanylate cyclase (GGDEF)-like protein